MAAKSRRADLWLAVKKTPHIALGVFSFLHNDRFYRLG